MAGDTDPIGGLPAVDALGDRSFGGRGDIGTFQITASSGSSSSASSSHSASRSLAVLRVPCCQDCRRELFEETDETSRFLELLRERERGADENTGECRFEGEGERDCRPLLGMVLLREGAEGDVSPRRIDDLVGALKPGCCCCVVRTTPLTWPFRLGYRGLALAVRSRNECEGGCGVLRLLVIEEKELRRPCTSSRLISSKCERSAGPMISLNDSE